MLLITFPFLIVLFICIWIYTRWQKVRRFWEQKGVPHHAPHPLYGSLTFLMKENPAVFMKQMYNDFKAPYVGLWLFWRPALMINDPELARQILVKDGDIFRDRALSSGKSDPVGALNIFTVNTVFADFTTDVIGESAFGLQSDSTITGTSAIREVIKEYMKYDIVRGLSWISIFFLPEAVNLFGFSLFPKWTTVYLRKVFRMIVEQRGGYDRDIKETKDLLDMLVKLKQDAAKENEDITEDILLAQAAIFLQGGFDTTAVALTYTIYNLAFSPEAQITKQGKLYKEIFETRKSDGDFNSTLLAEMPYLNATAKEPDKFIPDRFLPENENEITPYTYMPFGEGPRSCIGRRFAQQNFRWALAPLVQNFEFQAYPGSRKPSEVGMEKKGLFLMPEELLSVNIALRK